MKFLLILSALLIVMKGILGHSIMKLGIQNETKGDIYEIKEDKETNTITFANPKVEKPTLREIVYYHMIERPYGQEDRESPEFDDTMRPFTNSHGFPFLESVEKESDVIEDANKEDSTEVKDVIVDETPIEDDDVEVIYYYDEDEAFKNPIEFEEREIPTTHAPEEAVTEFDEFKTTVLQKISEEENEEITTQEPVTTVTAEPVFEKKAKSTRKLLFDRVKEKYYSKNETQSSPPSERRKRELSMDDIPEAPKLGELNYDSLPPYLRNLLSREEPQARKAIVPDDEEDMLDDIIRRMEKMMARLKTDDSSEEKPRGMKPRTYGMNLTEDSGYVWNDLTKPSIHYNVEASESTEETIPDDRSEEKHVKHEKEDDKARILKEDVEEEKDDKQEPKEEDNVSNEEKGRKRHEHNDAEDVIDQLMENKKFWNWLAEWTSVYMELLTDHINGAIRGVEEKVKKQVEKQVEELKKEIRKPKKEDDRLEPFKENDLKKTSKDDKEKKDVETKDSDKTIDDVKEKEKHESLDEKTKDDQEEKKKEEELNNNKEKEEGSKPKHGASNIEAKNVYGNTIGEKVTNIFIFYSNDDPDKVLKDVSKLKDSEDLNVDIKLNINKNKDEVAKKDESTQVPTEAKKDAIDVTTKAPEKVTSTTETPKDKEEKSTTITESTTTQTTKRPDIETTKNELTTESSKVETTERPTKEGKDDPEDKSKNDEKENKSGELKKEEKEETNEKEKPSDKLDKGEKQETNKKDDNSTESKKD